MRHPPLQAPQPPVAILRETYLCYPEEGKVFWLPRPPAHFVSEHAHHAFNRKFQGREALINEHPCGYHGGGLTIGGFKFSVRRSRVIWAMVHGEWPDLEVGHRNQIFSDDRIDNLRLQSASQRMSYARWGEHGRLGIRGVMVNEIGGYVANICADRRTRYLGTYSTLDAAISARNRAAVILHGEFARLVEPTTPTF